MALALFNLSTVIHAVTFNFHIKLFPSFHPIVFVAASLLREVATMSSSCKSVSGPIFGMFSLPEVGSSSPRQAGEISVGFIRRSLFIQMSRLSCVNFHGGSL